MRGHVINCTHPGDGEKDISVPQAHNDSLRATTKLCTATGPCQAYLRWGGVPGPKNDLKMQYMCQCPNSFAAGETKGCLVKVLD